MVVIRQIRPLPNQSKDNCHASEVSFKMSKSRPANTASIVIVNMKEDTCYVDRR